jgi:cell division septum initiation protein DivIVA
MRAKKMNDFTITKHGYNPDEVDNYIIRLKADYETKMSEQKDRIFYLKNQLDTITRSSERELMVALANAVEKAKQIEISSRNIFELETKRLKLLYARMDGLISNMSQGVSIDEVRSQLLKHMQDCRVSLERNLELQSRAMNMVDTENPVRKLLQKMNGKATSINLKNIESFVESPIEHQQTQRPASAPRPEKRVEHVEIKRPVKEAKPVFNKFLKEDAPTNKNFESIMFKNNSAPKKNNSVITANLTYPTPNESGFDLKAAVNPKDDLSEIMKAFDFFEGE